MIHREGVCGAAVKNCQLSLFRSIRLVMSVFVVYPEGLVHDSYSPFPQNIHRLNPIAAEDFPLIGAGAFAEIFPRARSSSSTPEISPCLARWCQKRTSPDCSLRGGGDSFCSAGTLKEKEWIRGGGLGLLDWEEAADVSRLDGWYAVWEGRGIDGERERERG